MKKIIKNQDGATAILLTFLMLSSITLVALITADLVQNGILASRTQINSTKALFAAEAGIEVVLDSVWKSVPPSQLPTVTVTCQGLDPYSGHICFDVEQDGVIDNSTGGPATGGSIMGPYTSICSDDCNGDGLGFDYQIMDNGSRFSVEYNFETDGVDYSTTTFTSIGVYGGVNRVVESQY